MTPKRKEPDQSTYAGRFAARLRALREKKGLTVEEMVDLMQHHGFRLSVMGYYTWERATRQINLNAIPAIAKALGVSIRVLFPAD